LSCCRSRTDRTITGTGENERDATDHVGSVDVGQTEVQEHQVEPGLGRRDDRLLAVGGRLHLVAVRLQARAERAPDLGLVVDDQHAGHARRSEPPRPASTGGRGPDGSVDSVGVVRSAASGVGAAAISGRGTPPSGVGSSNTTETPPVGEPSIRIRPPCARTIAPRDRQAEPATDVAARVPLVEGVEHTLPVLRRDPAPLVGDPHLHGLLPRRDGDRDLAVRRREPKGVLEQVGEDLVQLDRVGLDLRCVPDHRSDPHR
jgi:hypothetical protein